MTIDIHVHSALSDGTDSVHELVHKAAEAQLSAIALTDHDHMDGVMEAQREGSLVGLEVLRGVEMSTHIDTDDGRRSVHLLGYGCRPTPDLTHMLDTIRASRRNRIPATLARLGDLGMPLTITDVSRWASHAVSIGRPHIADAMVHHGYTSDRDEAFQLWLGEGRPAYVTRYTPLTSEGIALINEAGGVAVLAHPWGRGNRAFMTPEVIADMARSHGLFGLEVYHPDHDEQTRRELRDLAARLELVVTGSSDYHGTGKKNNPLGACLTDPHVFARIREAITERGGAL